MSFFPELLRGVHAAVAVAAFAVTAAPVYAKSIADRGTWETTLEVRDINGDGLIDAFYDTALDITWLAGVQGGYKDWADAKAWVEGLNVHGVSGWRLPDVKPIDGASFNMNPSWDGSTDVGYHVTSSELGHMFYVTLGNKAPGDDPASVIDGLLQLGADYGLINSGPFGTLPRFAPYWSGLESAQDPGDAWYFETDLGYQGVTGKNDGYAAWIGFSAWAVHSGDVPNVDSGVTPTVPEPENFALVLAGLVALVVARKRHA